MFDVQWSEAADEYMLRDVEPREAKTLPELLLVIKRKLMEAV